MKKEIKKIKDLPKSESSYEYYIKSNHNRKIRIQGLKIDYIIKYELSDWIELTIYDGTDSIVALKEIRYHLHENIGQYINCKYVTIIGTLKYNDQFGTYIEMESIQFMNNNDLNLRIDDCNVKRVELNVHTSMSKCDGFNTAQEYIDVAEAWGMKAIAFTDHANISENPQIESLTRSKSIKPIYGVELPFIDDNDYKIAYSNRDIVLNDATYVVFDLVTTGPLIKIDNIVELAAVKIKNGVIVDGLYKCVKQTKDTNSKLSESNKTIGEITKESVIIETALNDFLTFIKGCILVTINADLNLRFIQSKIKSIGVKKLDFPIIDILNLFRASYNKDEMSKKGTETFGLDEMIKYFNCYNNSLNSLIDKTLSTSICFVSMLKDLNQKGVINYNQINSVINPNNYYKYVNPSMINLLCVNQMGLKNLHILLSDALTTHFYKDARLLKSVLEKNRNGLIVSSGSYQGEVFQKALYESEEEMLEAMKFVDIVEVQPPSAYRHIYSRISNGEKFIKEIIVKIINGAKKLGKIVVATSESRYIYKEDKICMDIVINSNYNVITNNLRNYQELPVSFLRTTKEMLEEFSFLADELSYEIVVINTNLVADKIQRFEILPQRMFFIPDNQLKGFLNIPSILLETQAIIDQRLASLYGPNLHHIIEKRIDKEWKMIVEKGYTPLFYLAHLIVKKATNDGQMVGFRGSIGASYIAWLLNITQVNPLPSHYYCKKCKYIEFNGINRNSEKYGNEPLSKSSLDLCNSGYDLVDKTCPICKNQLSKDGHSIMEESLFGYDGDKIIDIDLNFTEEYRNVIREYLINLLGANNLLFANVDAQIGTSRAKEMVHEYNCKNEITNRKCENNRLINKIRKVKISNREHPGGIYIIPGFNNNYDVTPIQQSVEGFDVNSAHYNYQFLNHTFFKIDFLANNDLTVFSYIMDYVHKHQKEFPFDNILNIPIEDNNVYQMFTNSKYIDVSIDTTQTKFPTFGLREFNTLNVKNTFRTFNVKTFAKLCKTAGLNHGEGTWDGRDNYITHYSRGDLFYKEYLDKLISFREDIFEILINCGLGHRISYEIMEFVSKGNAKKYSSKWKDYKRLLSLFDVPCQFIDQCESIRYLFPKAHIINYVLHDLRLAWFKLYSPTLFYSAWFSKLAKEFDVKLLLKSKKELKDYYINYRCDIDQDLRETLEVVLEMKDRKINFLPIDINKSDLENFVIESKYEIRIPLNKIKEIKLNDLNKIIKARDAALFISEVDFLERTNLKKVVFNRLKNIGAFKSLKSLK